ncbi:alpha-L-arabinofuranosidase [Paraburkholderia youngii]|uniref:hypothetical protein n=1 Tax=Paraburkholderia youngii TaxID=2782701 RepID=UPI003D1E6AA6
MHPDRSSSSSTNPASANGCSAIRLPRPKTADEYGRVALETAKLMRAVDPTIQLAACGSSTHDMPTYGAREDRVLEHCFDQVDFISLHKYFENRHDSTAEFFGNIDVMDVFIKESVAVADSVAARKHSSKRIMLSFDEWNVWYKARSINDLRKPGWPSAPRLIEEHPRLSKWLPSAGRWRESTPIHVHDGVRVGGIWQSFSQQVFAGGAFAAFQVL